MIKTAQYQSYTKINFTSLVKNEGVATYSVFLPTKVKITMKQPQQTSTLFDDFLQELLTDFQVRALKIGVNH